MNLGLCIRTALSVQSGKFALILGQAIHSAHHFESSILASWKLAYHRITGEQPSGDSRLLSWERLLLSGSSGSSNLPPERRLVDELRNQLDWETERALQDPSQTFPHFLIDPAWVSDILIQHIDEYIERYSRRWMGARLSGWRVPQGFEGRQPFDKECIRYRELIFPGGGRIRVWHLDGTVSHPASIRLGLSRNESQSGLLQAFRRHHQRWGERMEAAPTWYSALHRPVLLAGASLSPEEGLLWSALADRERAYIEPGKRKLRKPIFHMREAEDELWKGWFQPLFEGGGDMAGQWERLKEEVWRAKTKR